MLPHLAAEIIRRGGPAVNRFPIVGQPCLCYDRDQRFALEARKGVRYASTGYSASLS